MSYYRWSLGQDVSLFLEVLRGNGSGLTGSDPHVMIRRYKNVDGGLLDNYYWSGSGFTSNPFSHSMSEVDSTNEPGVYVYHFSQSMIQSGTLYTVRYKHNRDPITSFSERHFFLASGSSGDLKVYESEID
jgi:hypothetical protein